MRAPNDQHSGQCSSIGLPLAALLVGNLSLALGPWLVKVSDLGPVAIAFWRVALAAPVLVLVFLRPVRQVRWSRALVLAVLANGVSFGVSLAIYNAGIVRTTLTNATVLGNCAVLLFPLYAFVIDRRRPSVGQVVPLVAAIGGAALLLGRSFALGRDDLAGDLLCLLAGLLYTVFFATMGRVRAVMAAGPALAVCTAAAVPALAIATVTFGEATVPHAWGSLIAIAIVVQVVGQGLLIVAVGRIAPVAIGAALLIQPTGSALVDVLALGHAFGVAEAIGAGLVAVALVLGAVSSVEQKPR